MFYFLKEFQCEVFREASTSGCKCEVQSSCYVCWSIAAPAWKPRRWPLTTRCTEQTRPHSTSTKAVSFKFPWTSIVEALSWSANTTAVVKQAHQWLLFLRVLWRNWTKEKLWVAFNRSAIETVVTYCITTWYAGCSAADRKAVQTIISNAQRTIGCPLSSLEDISSSLCLKQGKENNQHSFPLVQPGALREVIQVQKELDK